MFIELKHIFLKKQLNKQAVYNFGWKGGKNMLLYHRYGIVFMVICC